MSRITGKNALITGGASGIGKCMGNILLEKGLQTLIIWDLDQQALDNTSAAFREKGYRVVTCCVNIMDLTAVTSAAVSLEKENIHIDILINNAGIVAGKYFTEHSHEDIDRTMSINTSALMHLARIFLPAMISTGSGHIVNIASAAGLVSNPKMSVYVASKWAVIGWSDSLRLEMEKLKTGVKVTTVTPYYINTGMFAGVKSPVIPILEPETVSKRIIRGIEKNKVFVRTPRIVYFLPFIKGILPRRWFDVVVGKWMGVYKTMEGFSGRK
ncbi:MAG: SDR family oxidoreductase [Chitinophagaceae bacterium]|nr:SDR family oxidoreductase [Chitinophagaceae bacterium]MBL0336921.1 SDR family oxidoreductase [Chitinophagaceae bacterium]